MPIIRCNKKLNKNEILVYGNEYHEAKCPFCNLYTKLRSHIPATICKCEHFVTIDIKSNFIFKK